MVDKAQYIGFEQDELVGNWQMVTPTHPAPKGGQASANIRADSCFHLLARLFNRLAMPSSASIRQMYRKVVFHCKSLQSSPPGIVGIINSGHLRVFSYAKAIICDFA